MFWVCLGENSGSHSSRCWLFGRPVSSPQPPGGAHIRFVPALGMWLSVLIPRRNHCPFCFQASGGAWGSPGRKVTRLQLPAQYLQGCFRYCCCFCFSGFEHSRNLVRTPLSLGHPLLPGSPNRTRSVFRGLSFRTRAHPLLSL